MEDYFEKELMMADSKSLIKTQKKTLSSFPVDKKALGICSKPGNDEHDTLSIIMKNRPVDYGDKFLLDILDHTMERISIIVEGVRVARACDITARDIELMGLTIKEGELPFDVYKTHMINGGVTDITPDTYLYSVVFKYEKPIDL